MTLEKFIQVFCEYDKLNTDMCIIKYDDADYVFTVWGLGGL